MGTIYAVLVLVLVLVLGNLFKKIQPLLVEHKAPLSMLVRFVISVVPMSLMYTLPWGFLSAVLVVFGRMSAHQEITSFRVAGVSLVRLSLPVFVIGALLSLVSLWLNINVVPNAKASSKQLLYEQASRDPDSLLKPGAASGSFRSDKNEEQKVLIEGKEGEWVKGFHFYQLPATESEDRVYVYASRAALSIDRDKSQLRVKLEDAYFETHKASGGVDMVFADQAEPLLIDLKNTQSKEKKVSGMTNAEIRAHLNSGENLTEKNRIKLKAALIKRYSFSMACLAFAFIAVPLGLGARRKDTSRGLVISLIIGTIYFVMSIVAEEFKSVEGATLMLWAPNICCVVIGLILFQRAKFK